MGKAIWGRQLIKKMEGQCYGKGNHRLTCVSNLKEVDYSEFIYVKFYFANLEDEVNFQGKIHRSKETPQSLLCGCYMGFHTNYNSKSTLLYNENS